MAPKHQLVVSVGLIAGVIVVAWFFLFRQHILAPPMTIPAGPSLPDIGKQFEEQVEAFNKLAPPTAVPETPALIPTPPTVSDDMRKPADR
ncbi:MAG: hypothetical protein Q7S02_06040 [bacterium]|nr:hypothetical protein [bacterium]